MHSNLNDQALLLFTFMWNVLNQKQIHIKVQIKIKFILNNFIYESNVIYWFRYSIRGNSVATLIAKIKD